MATNMLNAFVALDKALHLGWQLKIRGGEDNDMVVVKVYKPKQAAEWTTVYVMGSVLEALTQTGETIREVIL